MSKKVRPSTCSKDLKSQIPVNVPSDYAWIILSKLQEDLAHFLTKDEYHRLYVIVRNRDYKAYALLAEDWGLQCINPDDILRSSAKYQLCSLIKKFQFPGDNNTQEANALQKFYKAEVACAFYNEFYCKELFIADTEWGAEIFTYARQFLLKLLGSEGRSSKLLDWTRHGPGATLSTRKGNTSLYHKYSEWPYTCTQEAIPVARFMIETDQRWFGALQDSYRSRYKIPKHYPLNMGRFWENVFTVVDHNRIAFVPKNAETKRTIAIEPLMNLYLQLGVDGFIRSRLKRFGVDLDDQTKNQHLAREGSLRPSGRFSTIDLSAASDSISLKLCELLLPPNWYTYLTELRCRKGLLTQGDQTHTVIYEKISSMGNGYTFALESAIFTAIVFAVFKAEGRAFDHEEFAVYGDDIIVPSELYYKTIEALRLCGFSANLDKTFAFGLTKESCGSDWHNGTPLRPIFLKDQPTNVLDLFTDFNRLKRNLELRFAIQQDEAPAVLGQILKWIPERFHTVRGPLSDEEFSTYLHTRNISGFSNYRKVCMFKFKRILVRPKPLRGDQFLFRKLMHDLRDVEVPKQWRPDRRLTGAGSRFTITSRKAWIVGYDYSTVSDWQSEYTEPRPAWPPLGGRSA